MSQTELLTERSEVDADADADAGENLLSAERVSARAERNKKACQGVASLACNECAKQGICPILKLRSPDATPATPENLLNYEDNLIVAVGSDFNDFGYDFTKTIQINQSNEVSPVQVLEAKPVAPVNDSPNDIEQKSEHKDIWRSFYQSDATEQKVTEPERVGRLVAEKPVDINAKEHGISTHETEGDLAGGYESRQDAPEQHPEQIDRVPERSPIKVDSAVKSEITQGNENSQIKPSKIEKKVEKIINPVPINADFLDSKQSEATTTSLNYVIETPENPNVVSEKNVPEEMTNFRPETIKTQPIAVKIDETPRDVTPTPVVQNPPKLKDNSERTDKVEQIIEKTPDDIKAERITKNIPSVATPEVPKSINSKEASVYTEALPTNTNNTSLEPPKAITTQVQTAKQENLSLDTETTPITSRETPITPEKTSQNQSIGLVQIRQYDDYKVHEIADTDENSASEKKMTPKITHVVNNTTKETKNMPLLESKRSELVVLEEAVRDTALDVEKSEIDLAEPQANYEQPNHTDSRQDFQKIALVEVQDLPVERQDEIDENYNVSPFDNELPEPTSSTHGITGWICSLLATVALRSIDNEVIASSKYFDRRSSIAY